MQLRQFMASALVVFFLLTSITPEIASVGSQETAHATSDKEYDSMRKMYIETRGVERGLRTIDPSYAPPPPTPNAAPHYYYGPLIPVVPPPPI